MGKFEFSDFDYLEKRARKQLPTAVFDHAIGYPRRGVTARANVSAFDQVTFNARAAVGFGRRELSVDVLGDRISMPVMLAPVGGLRLVHPAGAPACARAASTAGTISCISMLSGHDVDEIAFAADVPMWQQLYLSHGRRYAEEIIAGAARHSYRALVVTVDCNVQPTKVMPVGINLATARAYGTDVLTRPRWLAGFLRDGAKLEAVNAAVAPRTGEPVLWSDLAWAKELWPGALVVKGIMRVEDARRAVDLGADAIVVSNHGGLHLDGLPSALSALAAVVDAVGGQVEVYFDGGIRRGTDVMKVLALGAKAAFVGRAYVAGLAVGGRAGVDAALAMLRREMDTALGQLGCRSVSELDRTYIEYPGNAAVNSATAGS
ncbi:isopentenyl diphosphate isomerase/L-lactate dehydrogenase-like FMN-dependent dehydrogenase [Rhodococcus sp. 27YEA15]|uniref:alpha-hydroxy acid oxidase n=1 Tax=Rhodococcus sp. 27YEA15 TaxID=3156259 RepID=UPI003C7D461B